METKSKNTAKETKPQNDTSEKQEQPSIALNPNPRANENIREDKRKDTADSNDTGTEITDGEDG